MQDSAVYMLSERFLLWREPSAYCYQNASVSLDVSGNSKTIIITTILFYSAVINAIGSNSAWLDSTRLVTFDFVEPVEQVETSVSSETSCAFPTWRTTNDLVQV